MGVLHSVTLDEEKCIGCTGCIKRCPTEAIRVRSSKAKIIDERCIDCGNCVRVCNSHAKKATTDPLDKINQFKYKVAIPAPAFYTQFKKIRDPNIILTALKKLGFDEVFEVAKAAEIITSYSKKVIAKGEVKKPVISSACPAIVKLVEMRFPSLIPHVLPVVSPKEAMARYARKRLLDQGVPAKDIGIFFISPCGAKVTDSRYPSVIDESQVDGIISMTDVYLKVLPIVKSLKPEEVETLQMSTSAGIGWAAIGGESHASKIYDKVAVDGIENVIKILERAENRKLDVDFIECLACVNGCLGGPLTAEDSFIARNRMGKIKNYVDANGKTRDIDIYDASVNLDWQYKLTNKQVLKLDDNIMRALEKMQEIEDIYETLPKIDCGSCGAPNCRAMAEDVVQGYANIEDCIFMLREKVRAMAQDMVNLSEKLPPSIRHTD